tara:strand:- start:62 stop:991 length:930 start_codon:yes stop_codon:yes gene_type:complete
MHVLSKKVVLPGFDTNWKFNYIRRKKDTLVVTIGDSWTWGYGLSTLKKQIEEENFDLIQRMEAVFGQVVAKRLDSDFLLLAKPGESNGWIADQFDRLVRNFDLFKNYKKIYCVITFSEVGREFMGEQDTETEDYYNFLQDITSINDFLNKQSKKISIRITATEEKIKEKNLPIEVIKAVAFVDNNYPEGFVDCDKTWQQLIFDHTNIDSRPTDLFLMQPLVIEKLDWLLEYNHHFYEEGIKRKKDNVSLSTENFKRQRLELVDKIDKHMQLCNNTGIDYTNKETSAGHPNKLGHKLWAEYIFKKLIGIR